MENMKESPQGQWLIDLLEVGYPECQQYFWSLYDTFTQPE